MTKICSAAVVLLLSAYPALAQYSNARVTVFGAGSFLSGERIFVASTGGAVQSEYSKGPKIGFRFGVDVTDRVGAEAAYSFGSNDLRVVELGQSPVERRFDTNLHQFTANGSYYFFPPSKDWRPFATFGIGLTRFSPTASAKDLAAQVFIDGPTRIEASTRPGINFGGGLDRKVRDNLGVRFDFRDHIMGITRFGLPEAPLNPGGVYYPVKGAVHDLEIGVGVVFYFGG